MYAQDLSGIWKGYFKSSRGETYKLEFQVLVQPRGNMSAQGVSYSYLDIRFYGKATMTGLYMKNEKKLRIREIKTVEVRQGSGFGTCIMNYDLNYTQSGREEYLEGTYVAKTEVGENDPPTEWGSCSGGTVFLRRVANSDFYVELFLQNHLKKNALAKNKPSNIGVPPQTSTTPNVVKNTKPVTVTTGTARNNTGKTTNPPSTTVKRNPQSSSTTSSNSASTVIKKNTVVTPPTPPATDVAVVKKPENIAATDTKPVTIEKAVPKVPAPAIFKTRQNNLVKTFEVNSPEVTVKLYDNGEIDDDTISVYLNNKLIISKERLSLKPITFTVKISDENTIQELVMVAENMGRIPPNTSLMIVEAGGQQFRAQITSTEQKNAMVHFVYKEKEKQGN